MVQTGLRISQLIQLRRGGVHLGTGAHVARHGKGRKDRTTPLAADTVAVLRSWLAERQVSRPNRRFQPGPETRSAAMRSNTGWPSIRPPPHANAHR
jgi:integrase